MTRDEAYAKLEAAIAEYTAATEEGALVVDYVLLTATQTEEDLERSVTGYRYTAPSGQMYHNGLGLVMRAQMLLESRARGAVDE